MHEYLEQVLRSIWDASPRIIFGIIIFLIAGFIGDVGKRVIRKAADPLKKLERKQVVYMAASLFKILLVLIGLISGLGTAGVDVSAMVTGLGLTGFALGFAMKDAVSSFLSGALILIYQPYETGDSIVVAGNSGKVVEINLRYTVLEAPDSRILIPNSKMFNNNVKVMNPSA